MQWKRSALFGLCFGVGFAVMTALIVAGVLLYRARALGWDTNAIKAEFDHVENWQPVTAETKGSFEFHYILENRSGSDYHLELGDNPVLMIQRKNRLEPNERVNMKLPIFVPARQRVEVTFDLQHGGDIFDRMHLLRLMDEMKNDPNFVAPASLTKEAAVAFRAQEVEGFVLFDQAHHFEVTFPKKW